MRTDVHGLVKQGAERRGPVEVPYAGARRGRWSDFVRSERRRLPSKDPL